MSGNSGRRRSLTRALPAGSAAPGSRARRVLTALALLAALGFASGSLQRPASADQTDPRLGALFEMLRESSSTLASAQTEAQIWQIWLQSDSSDVNRRVGSGISAMNEGRLDDAIRIFGEVVEIAPRYAEGWNKRATAYYLADELDLSMADIRATLALEPRHFGAISGMGLIFMRLGDEQSALRAFEEVLKIHPRSPSANAYVERLGSRLSGKGA